jgi:UDP-glucuronate 4-epimerase
MIGALESGLGKAATRTYSPPGPAEMPITFANLDKSRKLLGYSPKVSFDEGMLLFIEWFRKQGLGAGG